ncbi:hypothetical protein AYP82_08215 [Lactobacillus crispatus]|uniref:Uncharacterized protein n=2 Tax=Lactobacillus crispatus TaxID=47770 RepID=A0A854PLU8_9LACO|nr:DUF6625 family protein [Lactobacillus crispatus]OXC22972.1 hypothetical protein AYP82_08215 [Lactobacillus crispatus]
MNRIAIVIPYFGKLPYYFETWLYSAKKNKNIDFLIFTNDREIVRYKLEDNIKVYIEEFENFKERFQKEISFPISLEYPYKICDYRPMYGIALKDILKNYDFWGFGDLDMVLGDIKQFISKETMENYDRIYNYGALSIYKNSSKMNNLFKEKNNYADCLSYKYVFNTNFSLYFDEMGGHKYGYGQSTVAIRKKNIKILINKDCADINPKYYNFKLFVTNQNFDYFEYVDGKIWGIVRNKRVKEFVYLHFQKRNIKIDSEINQNHFYIGPSLISSSKNKILKNCKDKRQVRKFVKNKIVTKSNRTLKLIKQGAIKYILNSICKKVNV